MKNRTHTLLGSLWLMIATSAAVACGGESAESLPAPAESACGGAMSCVASEAAPAQGVRFRVGDTEQTFREIAVSARNASGSWTFIVDGRNGDAALPDDSSSFALTVVVNATDPVGTWNVEGESTFLTEGALPSYIVGDPVWTPAGAGSPEVVLSALEKTAFVTAYQERFVQQHTGFLRIDSVDEDTVIGALELTVDGEVPIFGDGFDTHILTKIDGTFTAVRD